MLWILYFALVGISLFVTFSALTSLSIKVNSTAGPIASHWMTIAIGVVIICLIQMAPFTVIERMGTLIFGVGILGVLYVMLKGGGVGDAARHTSIGQPSELLMLGLILSCASFFNTLASDRSYEEKYFYYIAIFIMISIFLILVDNLSTAVLTTVSVFAMMAVGHISFKRIGTVIGVLAAIFLLFMSVTVICPDKTKFDAFAKEHSYARVVRRAYTWKERFARFGEKEEEKYVIDKENPQVSDAKIAICSGGWFPKGPSSSTQRYHLAEAYTDYIFSIAAEEGGFFFGLLIMLIYVGVFWRAVMIVWQEKKLYRILLVTGCAVLIVLQATVHIAVSLGAMPVTGQPLPMISKGGSSVVVISACFGIIAKVSAEQKNEVSAPAEETKEETTES